MPTAIDRFLDDLVARPPDATERHVLEHLDALRATLEARTDEVGDVLEATGGGSSMILGLEAASASVAPEKARLLHRLVRVTAPARVAEFGSCFGLSGAHMATALGDGAELITVEGSPSRHAVARETLETAAPGRATCVLGFFDDHLDVLDSAQFAFIDGNHQVKPTLGYVEEAVRRMARPAAIVLDDVSGWADDFTAMWDGLREDRRFDFAGAACGVGILTIGRPPGIEADPPDGLLRRAARRLKTRA